MSDKVLASMPPPMVSLLRRIRVDDAVLPHHVHGPVLKGLMVRGLVRVTNNQLKVTWRGQQVLELVGAE